MQLRETLDPGANRGVRHQVTSLPTLYDRGRRGEPEMAAEVLHLPRFPTLSEPISALITGGGL